MSAHGHGSSIQRPGSRRYGDSTILLSLELGPAKFPPLGLFKLATLLSFNNRPNNSQHFFHLFYHLHVSDSIMDLPALVGLPADILKTLHQNFQNVLISRELVALCQLCPADAPAAAQLPALDKQALLHLSNQCVEAINQWCGCPRDYEATLDAPSLTSRNSRLCAKVCTPSY